MSSGLAQLRDKQTRQFQDIWFHGLDAVVRVRLIYVKVGEQLLTLRMRYRNLSGYAPASAPSAGRHGA